MEISARFGRGWAGTRFQETRAAKCYHQRDAALYIRSGATPLDVNPDRRAGDLLHSGAGWDACGAPARARPAAGISCPDPAPGGGVHRQVLGKEAPRPLSTWW